MAQDKKFSDNPTQQRATSAVAVLGIAAGLGAAYQFTKILWAIPFGIVCIGCVAYLIGAPAWVRQRIKPRLRLPLQLAFALVIILISISFVIAEYDKQQAALTEGILEPREGGLATTPLLELADSGVTDSMEKEPNGQWELLRHQSIKVEVENGKPVFSTIIRDRSGNIIVEVKKNHWSVSPSRTVVWDKNYSKDTLEVKDGRGKVVLQVRLLQDRVQLQGEWHNENGVGVRLAKTHAPLVEGGAQIVALNHFDDDDPSLVINPIFKYPSAEFWSEFEKN